MDVGFVGLGAMGHPMVVRLLAAGHVVHVYNRSRGAADDLARLGALPQGSARAVAEHAAFVHTALPSPAAVDAVFAEFATVADAHHRFVEHSTIRPDHSRRWAATLGERGAAYLDAPVSGGPAGAVNGTLTVMVGGEVDTFEAALPLLRAFGSTIARCGPVGSGQVVKLVNQLLVGVHTAAAAEAVAFGARMGADLEPTLALINQSYGASMMLARNGPRFLARDFAAATPIRILIKDLGLIHDEARDLGVPLPIGGLVEQRFLEARNRGLDDADMAAMIRLWEASPD